MISSIRSPSLGDDEPSIQGLAGKQCKHLTELVFSD